MARKILLCGFIGGKSSIWRVLNFSPMKEVILGVFPITFSRNPVPQGRPIWSLDSNGPDLPKK